VSRSRAQSRNWAIRLPPELGIDGVLLAGVFAQHCCTGCGNLEDKLRSWQPEAPEL
jgi:hypothetical protein